MQLTSWYQAEVCRARDQVMRSNSRISLWTQLGSASAFVSNTAGVITFVVGLTTSVLGAVEEPDFCR